MRAIEYLRIEIEPSIYYVGTGLPEKELHITVQVNNRRYSLRRTLPPDDLKANFDLIFEVALEHARRELKTRIIEETTDPSSNTPEEKHDN